MIDTYRSTVSLDDLVIGSISKVSLQDAAGRELIPIGTRTTVALVEGLRREGILVLHVSGATQAPTSSANRSELPPVTQALEETAAIPTRLQPYDPVRMERLTKKFEACESMVDHLIESLRNGSEISTRDAEEQVSFYVDEMKEDPDPVLACALEYQANLTLARRCVQFSLLSMAIGMRQKLGRRDMQDIGTAALMHDWSLFSLVPEARFPHFRMSDSLRNAFHRHPLSSESLLHTIRGTTQLQQLLVGQVHELLDGSGFPRGLANHQIHPFARILSVADSYLTLTSPPRGFVRILPCDAIAYIIAGASKGRFAPAVVTALLEAVTMYPVGSILELNDTTQVRVIRSNGTDYGYPIVQSLLDPSEVIDLRNSKLFITRPVLSKEYDEARLPETYKELNSAMRQPAAV